MTRITKMRVYVDLQFNSYIIVIDDNAYHYDIDDTLELLGSPSGLIDNPHHYRDITPDEMFEVDIFIPSIDEYIDSEVFGELERCACVNFLSARIRQIDYHGGSK